MKYFKQHKSASAVAFLYDSIFFTLLARNNSNKVIISERGDPAQSSGSKTVEAFMKKEFCKSSLNPFLIYINFYRNFFDLLEL